MNRIDQDTVKQLKAWKKQGLVRREKVLSEFDRLIVGTDEETLLPELCERFGVKRVSTIKRWLAERGKYLNPASKAINDAMVLRQMGSLLASVAEYDEMLSDRINEIEESDGDWVDMEQSEDSRGSVQTKRISKYEALLRASKERVSNSQEFFKAARAIVPQTVLNQVIDNRRELNSYSDDELDSMLKEHNV